MNSYLKYAFGEIILVVLGILIAMYIRSEYEAHQEHKNIESTAVQVIEDLRKDTSFINRLIRDYGPLEADFLAVISNQMTQAEYDSCHRCPYLVSRIRPFNPSQEGYSILQTFNPNYDSKVDTLLHQTKRFYSDAIPGLELINNMIKADVTDNLTDWKNSKRWFYKWINGEMDAEMNAYFFQSEDYKNKVASFHLLVYQNYIHALRDYAAEATLLADEWEKTLLENK